MATKTEVPITGSVLAWAIREGGWTIGAFADALGFEDREVRAWIDGRARPGKTEFRRIAERLRRPTALFFRSEPPTATPAAALREARGPRRTPVNPDERLQIRWAAQIQRAIAFVLASTSPTATDFPQASESDDPHSAAENFREWLGITVQDQLAWPDDRRAFVGWKRSLENNGFVVLQFQMGEFGLRGFSLWNEWAPLVAVNNSMDQDYVRTFTMFHECAHIVRRDASACRGFVSPSGKATGERWCELFSAALLLPRAAVAAEADLVLTSDRAIDGVRLTRSIAKRFKVSLRATALRLIDLGYAEPSLYAEIEQLARPRRRTESKQGGGRSTVERRVTELGSRVPRVLLGAAEKGIIGPLDAAEYMRIPHTLLSELGEAAASA